jgi:hypothetical protein
MASVRKQQIGTFEVAALGFGMTTSQSRKSSAAGWLAPAYFASVARTEPTSKALQ